MPPNLRMWKSSPALPWATKTTRKSRWKSGSADIADLGANLPEVASEIVEAPQVGEGGLNNEPPQKES